MKNAFGVSHGTTRELFWRRVEKTSPFAFGYLKAPLGNLPARRQKATPELFVMFPGHQATTIWLQQVLILPL
uniref:Transposase n=1 Tax=Mesocestoides corti TaxID=53468 RepID=A0A5K3EZH4_MESCO